VLKTIQELNEAAKKATYEMSALSFAAYPSVADKYMLMPCGACMGIKQGPMLLAKRKLAVKDLGKTRIAIPGSLTTAYLVLKMIAPGAKTIEIPFDKITDAILRDEVDAGLIIHEAQMTYEKKGLNKIVDFGEWWFEETGLPLPLGGNVIRKDLELPIAIELVDLFQRSIKYALANRSEAAAYAIRYARGLPIDQATQFIGKYVNDLTVDYGEVGKKALIELFKRAYQAGALDHPVRPEFISLPASIDS
jgi:1,4-dihydroxy-6-naphthoate synthase